MKILLYYLLIIIFLSGCQSNPTINIDDYSIAFEAKDYPKSIIDDFRKGNDYKNLNDYQIAIRINSESLYEDLLDQMLLRQFNLMRSDFEGEYFALKKKSLWENSVTDAKLEDEITLIRTRKWLTDCWIQYKYGGKVYFDTLSKTPKPIEAYQKMYDALKATDIIQISDEFLEQEISKHFNNPQGHLIEFKGDINYPVTWISKKTTNNTKL